jgi:flagella basal body P-ring formation protein FlgA
MIMRTWSMRAVVVVAMLAGAVSVLRAQAPALATPAVMATTPLARDQRLVRLPVATRDLARGDTLQASDIALVDSVITWRWNTAPDTTRALPGWVTRRAILAGEVLRAPAVMPPPLVLSGATVTAIWQDGPLRLVITGVATNTAAEGAHVGVRIDRTRRLDGIAVGPNIVRLR